MAISVYWKDVFDGCVTHQVDEEAIMNIQATTTPTVGLGLSYGVYHGGDYYLVDPQTIDNINQWTIAFDEVYDSSVWTTAGGWVSSVWTFSNLPVFQGQVKDFINNTIALAHPDWKSVNVLFCNYLYTYSPLGNQERYYFIFIYPGNNGTLIP